MESNYKTYGTLIPGQNYHLVFRPSMCLPDMGCEAHVKYISDNIINECIFEYLPNSNRPMVIDEVNNPGHSNRFFFPIELLHRVKVELLRDQNLNKLI